MVRMLMPSARRGTGFGVLAGQRADHEPLEPSDDIILRYRRLGQDRAGVLFQDPQRLMIDRAQRSAQ